MGWLIGCVLSRLSEAWGSVVAAFLRCRAPSPAPGALACSRQVTYHGDVGGGPLINLGNLTKPATVLVEKVCNAVGVIFEPTQVRRLAQAQVDAERIKAFGQINLREEIERRAIARLVHQEVSKQENIESITAQALMMLPADAKVDRLDEDWIAHFFKQCDTVSDKEMQSLWARMLAGEATQPGSFSKRTVDFVSTMDRRDAHLFTILCQFACGIGYPNPHCMQPLIYNIDDEIYKFKGISFSMLQHSEAIGLITVEATGYRGTEYAKVVQVFYDDQIMEPQFPHDANNSVSRATRCLPAWAANLLPYAVRNAIQRFGSIWRNSGCGEE